MRDQLFFRGRTDYIGGGQAFPMMRHVSFDEFRKNLAKYMDEVSGSHASLHIKRDAGSVVMMSEDEFEGWKETIHLLRSPTNAERLLVSVADAEAGKLDQHEPIRE